MNTRNQDAVRAVVAALEAQGDAAQRQVLTGFFKTGKGEYGEGDRFLGVRVPQTRQVAKHFRKVDLAVVDSLLQSAYHEVRLCGLLILVEQFTDALKAYRRRRAGLEPLESLLVFYLGHADRCNNWDLVDLTAPKVLGEWLMIDAVAAGRKRAELDRLAGSSCLWEQRIAMVCTMTPLRYGSPEYTLTYAERLVHHPHDLMHKAVGWMLREMGKRVDMALLRAFLERHAATMPRTALRYAIELMSADERKHWMDLKPQRP